jgi:hypothetical protein
MKKLVYLLAGISLAAFMAVPALAQNSKAGGTTTNLTVMTAGNSWFDVGGMTTDIRTSQQTDLTLDVAMQCSLATDTHVKTKGGAKGSATAEAGVKVRVRIQELDKGELVGAHWYASPSNDILATDNSGVTYCYRSQTLEAVLQGQIDLESCVNSEGVFDPDSCTLSDEEIRLILSTLSVHAFNFFTYDLASGDYRITVEANPDTDISTDDEEGASSTAIAAALIGLGSMVVDEVHFGAIPN